MSRTKALTIARFFFALAAIFMVSWIAVRQQKPTLFIIGDSTVRNGDGTGKNNQMGWGSVISPFFDTTRIGIRNYALGGRSSRTFITEGHWDKVLSELKPGDYVIMQFGHNDASPLDDTARARGTIRGIGDESKETYNPIMKKQEVVYSYGWYMRKYIRDTKAKGAVPIVCSLVPRNNWTGNKVQRSDDSYGKWAKDVAAAEGAYFIDLNNMIGDQYEKLGQEKVNSFFQVDHTHTNKEGAELNASIVVEGLRQVNGLGLKNYIVSNSKIK
jgi:rhamnogalacturonan acetylesterase